MIEYKTNIKNKLNNKYGGVFKVWNYKDYLYINMEDPFYLTSDLKENQISYREVVDFEHWKINDSIITVVIPPRAIRRFKKIIL